MLYPVVSACAKSFRRLTRRNSAKVSKAVDYTLQALEARQLLSAVQVGTVLTINGTTGDDSIVVQLVPGDATHLEVLGAGATQLFTTAKVKQININGLAGDDYVAVNVAIKTTIAEGDGNDTLIGGTGGHDSLTAGAGNDSIQANGAYDYIKAGDGADTLVGVAGGHDTLIAGAGADSLTANGSYDSLSAGNGNDTLVGGPGGHATLLAGNGADTVQASGAYNYLKVGDGADTLVGGAGIHNTLIAGLGDDSLTGNGSYDSLSAGNGNDTLVGGAGGHETLLAGNGADSVQASGAYNYLKVGDGADTLVGGAGIHNTLLAGLGDDSLTGNGSYDSLSAGNGNDTLVGGPGGHETLLAGNGIDSVQATGAYNYIKVGSGPDTLVGGAGGHNTLLAGSGNDSLQSNGIYDYVSAGDGADTLTGSAGGHDTLLAGKGADFLTGNGTYDYLSAGNGNDVLVGGPGGHETLLAGNGTDSLTSNGAHDYLKAGNGNDTLVGGAGGHDTLLAGTGADSLTGNGTGDYLSSGSGNDTLVGGMGGYETLIAGSGTDTVTSKSAYDHITVGNGTDTVIGGPGGHNVIVAGSGTDTINATGGAANWLQAGAGNDTLFGGSSDTFHVGTGVNLVSNNYGATTSVKTAKALPALPKPAGANNVVEHDDDIVGPNGILSPSSSVGYNNIDTIEAAYSIPDPTQAGSPTGAGQTIAIVDAYGPTPAEVTSDLTFFSLNPPLDDLGDAILSQASVPLLGGASTGGLTNPAATLPVPTTSQTPGANQFTFNIVLATPTGATPVVDPVTAADQATETDLDVEWAHAIAPKAKIMLFEAASLSFNDVIFAVNQAALFESAHGGGVVSMSFGGGEFAGETQFDKAVFGNPAYKNVSFLASSGDTGAQASYPALSPFVTSVGGTTLLTSYVQDINSANGVFPWLEYAWVNEGAAVSQIEPLPAFQEFTTPDHVAGSISIPPGSAPFAGIGAFREGPDVAMLADPETGVAVYNTAPSQIPGLGQISGWSEVGGTSLACPMFAAIVALANQTRATVGTRSDANGDTTLGAELNGAIYFLNNSEYEQPPEVATPSTDKTTTPPTPILGNFQSRGELSGLADISIPVPDQTLPNPPPTPEAPSLSGATGLFFDIGGAFTDKGAADHSQGIVGLAPTPLVNTNLAWDAATGWGSPNVNNLVEANPSTNPNTAPFIGTDIGPGTTEGGGQITFGAGFTPTTNLSNISINLDTFFSQTTGGAPVSSRQQLTVPFTINNLKVSITQYAPFTAPPSPLPMIFRDTGTLLSIATSTVPGILNLTLNGSTATLAPPSTVGGVVPPTTTITELFTNIPYNAAGTFAGAVPNPTTGQMFWLEGQITGNGTGINGDFFQITGVDSNGNPIATGTNDAGGDIRGSFNSN